jgi:ABC-2 type transport system permease protein
VKAMTKFWIVFFQTYKKHIKSRTFVISSIVTMIMIAGLTNAGQVAKQTSIGGGTQNIGIYSENDTINQTFIGEAKKQNKKWVITTYDSQEKGKADASTGKIKALIVMQTQETQINTTFYAKNLSEQVLQIEAESFAKDVRTSYLLGSFNLTKAQIDALNAPFDLEKVALEETAKSSEVVAQTSAVIFILLVLIYASVVFYGSSIAIEVASEKSSRIMEVLVSSTPPVQQMFGKIVAIASVGLTQYALFFLFGRSSYQLGGAASAVHFDQVPISTFVYAVIFYILGYFLYSSLLAMVGSLASRIEEVYQMVAPINFFMIIGFILSLIALANPSAPFVTVMSFIPFFTPMLFFLRVALLSVPTIQIVIAIVIMLISIVFFANLGAKVYKGGVLIYGKATYKNIVRALRLTKKK